MIGRTNVNISRKYINDQNELGVLTGGSYTGEITAPYDGFISATTGGTWPSAALGVWEIAVLVNNVLVIRLNGNLRSGDPNPYVGLGPVPVKKGDIFKISCSSIFTNHISITKRYYERRDYSNRI